MQKFSFQIFLNIIISFNLILNITPVYLENNDKTTVYPPGYINSLNSTIVNLMNQLTTYQQYIEQAFQPLNTYDKVFAKPISTFKASKTEESPTNVEKEDIDKEQESEMNSRKDSVNLNESKQNSHESFKKILSDSIEQDKSDQHQTHRRPYRRRKPNNKNNSGSDDTQSTNAKGSNKNKDSVQFSHHDDDDDDDESIDSDKIFPIDTRRHQNLNKNSNYEQRFLTDECGIFNPKSAQVVGGHILWPWSVTLGKAVRNGFLYKCSGSLITKQYLITSAHCVNRDGEIDTARIDGTKIKFETINVHPGYKEGIGYNDIAIIKLIKPLLNTTERQVMPVCSITPSKSLKENLEKLNGFSWTTEWKYSNTGGRLQMVIRNLYTSIRSNKYCEEQYKQFLTKDEFSNQFPTGLDSSIICASSARRGICQKSNGNSLLTRDQASQKSYLIGIVIKGQDDCNDEESPGRLLPGLFTKISYFTNWIGSVIIGNNNSANDEAKQDKEDEPYYYYYDDDN